MSIGAGGKLTITACARPGGLPEGVVYNPKNDYLYVGNYVDTDVQVFHIGRGKLTEVGPRLKLPGQPASMRAPAR
jgi:DNA-binding beta-propeller fold protein YncE